MKFCLLCGKDNNSIKIATNKKFLWDTMYCKKCKLAYSYENDIVIRKAYKKFYQGEYWHTKDGKSSIYRQDLKNKMIMMGIKVLRTIGISPLVAISHYTIMQKYYSKLSKGKFLEIGPGEGYSLRFFNKKFEIKAIEPDVTNTNNINKYFRKKICQNGDIETDAINGKFDVVYMSHVFEHLISPKEFLKKISKHINDEGVIFIEVPNCENKKMMKISTSEVDTHTYHFTVDSIKSLFEGNGFEVLECNVYNPMKDNFLSAVFKSIFNIHNYEIAPLKSGIKIVLVARKKIS